MRILLVIALFSLTTWCMVEIGTVGKPVEYRTPEQERQLSDLEKQKTDVEIRLEELRKIPEEQITLTQSADLGSLESQLAEINSQIAQIEFAPLPPPVEIAPPAPTPTITVEVNKPLSLTDRITSLQKLSADPVKNTAEIKKQLDSLKTDAAKPVPITFEDQLKRYEDITKTEQSLTELKKKASADLISSFDATSDALRAAASKVADTVIQKENTQAQDALAGRDKQSVWGKIVVGVRTLVDFVSRNLSKRSTVTDARLKGASNNIKNTISSVDALNTHLSDVNKVGDAELETWNNFVNSDYFLPENFSRLTPDRLQGLLNDFKLGKEFLSDRSKLDVVRSSLQSDINDVANNISTLNVSYILHDPTSSLYAQFDAQTKENYEGEKSTGYAIKPTADKRWVPTALKFSSYAEMLNAPSQEIANRYEDALKKRDAALAAKDAGIITPQALAAVLTDFNVARELQRDLRSPLARDIFVAYLDAQGLIDGTPKGPDTVNKLVLPPQTAQYVNDTLFTQVTDISRRAGLLVSDHESQVQSTLNNIENRITQLQDALGQSPSKTTQIMIVH